MSHVIGRRVGALSRKFRSRALISFAFAALILLAACSAADPTDETFHASEVMIAGTVTDAQGASVRGVVVLPYQDVSVGRICTGEVSEVPEGIDTTNAMGQYLIRSLHITDDTVCATVRAIPPEGSVLAERSVTEVLLPYRYPSQDVLDTVRVDFILNVQ